MTKPVDYVNAHRDRFVRELQEIVRIPSVSTDPEHRDDVIRAAEWVRAAFEKIGLETKLIPTGGHPAVLAQLQASPGAPTAFIYGHYDVQPAKREEGWAHDPFGAEIEGDSIYGRGSADNKGQFVAHIKGVETYLMTVGQPTLNLRFLIEGEEEIGSPNLAGLIRSQKSQLEPDVIVISDTSMFQKELPTICYGLRGLVAAEIRVHAATRDLHSGTYGGTVINPIHLLAEILAVLHHPDGSVAVPGFYDDVRPLETWEREMWASLPWNEDEYRADLGLDCLLGEPGYTALERVWARPALDINGIHGGFTGAGLKTVIPCQAYAKVTCRLVPDQQPDKVLDRLESYVMSFQAGGAHVEMERRSAAEPVRLQTAGKWIEALKTALQKGFGRPPIFIREGGSIPIVGMLQKEFGVPILLTGFARPSCRAHGPDEYFSLSDFFRATHTSAILLEELSKTREDPN